MAFEIDPQTGKVKFNFVNLLAVVVLLICASYFFWISIPPKMEVNENRNIGEIKTAFIAAFMLVLNYFFGSSKSSASKDVKIDEMQKTAAALAASNTGTSTEVINTENISGNVTAEKVVTNETKTDEA